MNTLFTYKLPILVCLLFLFGSTSVSAFELVCPDDVTVGCDEEIWDLSIYGNAKYKDYSGWHDAGQPYEKYHISECGTGYITRKWSVYNPYDHRYIHCTQTIYVGGVDLDGSFITWPKTGLDLTGCNPNTDPNALPYGYQRPTWVEPDCAMLGVSYEDNIFYFGGACKKLVRKWSVINCCDYNPYTGYGIWVYYQEINITLSDVPQIKCPEDVVVSSTDCSGAYVNVPKIIIPNSECSENVVIMNDSPFASNGGADASGVYPIGTTIVTFTADYGCWKKTMCTVKVTVKDDKAPTPYCIYGLAIALMPVDADGDGIPEDGMVEIWASDFDRGSFDNCGNGKVYISFSSDINDTSRTFTCDHVGRNDIQMWVTDADGNQNYCNTYVKVQNNAANIPNCEDSDEFSYVKGKVKTHYDTYVENAAITAIGTEHAYEIEERFEEEYIETVIDTIFSASGNIILIIDIDTIQVAVYDTVHATTYQFSQVNGSDYSFDYLPHYADYQIVTNASDNNQLLITKEDILLIEEYIAGNIEFDGYQKLAADVNKDSLINELDIFILDQIVNNNVVYTNFDNKWHFIRKSINVNNLPEGERPFEGFYLTDFRRDLPKQNLIGYRIGDVTNQTMEESSDNDGAGITLKSRSIINENAISFNPNPFNENLNLTIEAIKAGEGMIRMYDMKGMVVHSETLTLEKGINELNLNNINSNISGMLIYSVIIDDQTYSGKLMKIN